MTHKFIITVQFDMTNVADDRVQRILDGLWTQLRNAVTDIRTTADVPSTLTMERNPIDGDMT